MPTAEVHHLAHELALRDVRDLLVHELLPERGRALFEQLGANAQRAARGPVAKTQLPSCANTGTSWIAGSVRL